MPETAKKTQMFHFDEMAVLVKDKIDNPAEADVDRYVGLEHLDPESLKIRRWGVPTDVEASKLVFKSGDIIFGKRRVYQRKLAVADFEGICSAHAMVLRPKPDVVLPQFLPFFMQSDLFMERSLEISVGSLSPTINWKTLAKQVFALPPLEEQRRIAEVLQAAEANINALRKLNHEMGKLRGSAIDSLTCGLAAGMSTVGEHCEMQNGRPFPGNEYCEDGQLLLRPGNLDPSGYLTWDDDKTKRVPHRYREEASDFVVNAGDVLINLTAQSLEDGFMGRVCIVRDGDESLLNQRIGRFRDFSERLIPEFLFRVLQNSSFKRHAIGMCEGSKIKHLFWEHISRFQFPLPDIDEQSRVIQELRGIDSAVGAAGERIESAFKLKKRQVSSLLESHVEQSV
ncbi:MAG: restriction endonuclease subunit S [Actinomycetia bacterium]|nr:restriction endonuclease subunit S [Actinomycetes bacterium]